MELVYKFFSLTILRFRSHQFIDLNLIAIYLIVIESIFDRENIDVIRPLVW